MDHESDPDPGSRGGRWPLDEGAVTVPVWRLRPPERAALLQIVRAGGRALCQGPARDQIIALLQTGYLARYDEGSVILTPAALRAIAAEVDRRATAGDRTAGDPGEDAEA